ncbi:hypothetical protein CEXT_183181 [Caerostris extrusa]|uniref:Uncharacterized protein n=1 Tax=Caerostris extrusa TaxID=172846 RepID=A0AAV4Y5I6_CAEEX|nr:hypothetical protein CEXT_183181 [Caerostris extrusa]
MTVTKLSGIPTQSVERAPSPLRLLFTGENLLSYNCCRNEWEISCGVSAFISRQRGGSSFRLKIVVVSNQPKVLFGISIQFKLSFPDKCVIPKIESRGKDDSVWG